MKKLLLALTLLAIVGLAQAEDWETRCNWEGRTWVCRNVLINS